MESDESTHRQKRPKAALTIWANCKISRQRILMLSILFGVVLLIQKTKWLSYRQTVFTVIHLIEQLVTKDGKTDGNQPTMTVTAMDHRRG